MKSKLKNYCLLTVQAAITVLLLAALLPPVSLTFGPGPYDGQEPNYGALIDLIDDAERDLTFLELDEIEIAIPENFWRHPSEHFTRDQVRQIISKDKSKKVLAVRLWNPEELETTREFAQELGYGRVIIYGVRGWGTYLFYDSDSETKKGPWVLRQSPTPCE